MAFSKTPDTSTYRTQQIAFSGDPSLRSGDMSTAKDLQIINFYYEFTGKDNRNSESALKKRPGLANTSYTLSKPGANDVIRGSFYFPDINAFFWVVDTGVYRLKPGTSATPVNIQTLTTSSGQVGFCSYIKSDNTRYVVFTDGTKMYAHNVTGATSAEIVDADLPTPHVPCPVYLDGYIFIAKASTGDIYNSNVDDLTAWTPGDFMSVEMAPDHIQKLIRTRNYIVALGKESIEFFYDAGVATGSPLQRNDAPYKTLGFVTGLCSIGDTTFFVGQEPGQGLRVYAMNGFTIKAVSNEYVERSLQVTSSTENTKGSVYLDRDGYSLTVDGHNFYALVTTQTTWVFDYEHNKWYEWKNTAGTALGIEAVWNEYNSGCYVAIAGKTDISVLSPKVYQDYSSNFTATYITERIDFETWNRKFMSRLMLYTDRPVASGTSNIAVSYSDDDYLSYSTARNINVFAERPCLYRLGKFINRSFKFAYADNYPLRLRGIEVELNIGRN